MKYMLITALLAFSCISSTAQEEMHTPAATATANGSIPPAAPMPFTSRLSITAQRPTPNRGPCFYQQSLNKAIYKGELPFIKKLIEDYGTSCMPLDTGNRTPLHVALREYEDEQMADYLLNHDMQYNVQDEDGNTVLHVAILCKKSADFIEKLLAKNRVPLDARNKRGRTALHEALIEGADEETIECLIEHTIDYADEDDVDIQDENGNTATHLAVLHKKSIPLLKKLLPEASLDICNNRNRTPLEEALDLGAEDAARELIAQGSVFRQDEQGDFPIFTAIKKHDQQLFNLIIRLKAIGNQHDQFKRNPLHAALFYAKDQSDERMIHMLMDNTPSAIRFEEQQDVDGKTPLHIAMMSGPSGRLSKPLIEKIIGRTSHLNAYYDNNGHGPIHAAVLHNFIVGIKALIDAGVSITSPNKDGKTPLELTFDTFGGGGYGLIRSMVIDCGANANQVGADGNSILYAAAIARKPEHMKQLILSGAVKNFVNRQTNKNIATMIEERPDKANFVNELTILKNF